MPDLPHGTLLGEADGVPGYAANYEGFESKKPLDFKNYIDGVYTGIKWQCVEYARRWWLVKKGVLLGNVKYALDIWEHPHVTVVETDQLMALELFPNGSSDPPQVHDLLIYDSSEDLHTGHVAVVSQVLSDAVRLGEQNRHNDRMWPGDYAWELPLKVEDGKYWIIDTEYKLKGWVRLCPDNVIDRPPYTKPEPKLQINGELNPETILALQRHIDTRPNSQYDNWTIMALQSFLNLRGTYHGEINGTDDPETIKALQTYINNHWILAAPEGRTEKLEVDGVFGKDTISVLQNYLNTVPLFDDVHYAMKTFHTS